MTESQLPPCGHAECARERDDMYALAKSLGFREVYPGVLEYASTDPEAAMRVIRAMTGGVDGLARDLIAQAEAINRRAAEEGMKIHAQRVEARGVRWHIFWSKVRGWLNHPTRKK